jgi:hypothetical protein
MFGFDVSSDKTHHIKNDSGTPAYKERYDLVEPFQKENDNLLAWARIGEKWIRIGVDGKQIKMSNTSSVG